MGSSIAATKTKAPAVATPGACMGSWNDSRIGIASTKPPRIVRAVPEDDLGAARGIGLALIAGGLIWVGLGWAAASLLARFF